MTKLQWSETFQDLWEVFDDVLGAGRDASTRPRPDVDLRAAARPGHVVAVGHHLGRLVPGPAQHHRRARARPAPIEELAGVLRPHRRPAGVRRRRARATWPTGSTSTPCAASSRTRDGDGHPAALWKAVAEQGWLAVLVPEEHDGLGLGLVEAQVIARALGAGVAPGPWRGTVLAAEAVRLAGSPEQQARLAAAARRRRRGRHRRPARRGRVVGRPRHHRRRPGRAALRPASPVEYAGGRRRDRRRGHRPSGRRACSSSSRGVRARDPRPGHLRRHRPASARSSWPTRPPSALTGGAPPSARWPR